MVDLIIPVNGKRLDYFIQVNGKRLTVKDSTISLQYS